MERMDKEVGYVIKQMLLTGYGEKNHEIRTNLMSLHHDQGKSPC
jgi:hypothetical protein